MKYFVEALKITKNQAIENRQQAVVAGYRSVVMSYGEMLMSYKKYARAKDLFEEYLKANPDDGEVRAFLKKCESILGKISNLGHAIEKAF